MSDNYDVPALLDLIGRLRYANKMERGKTEKVDADNERLTAKIERLTRRLEGATRLLNAWHFEYHHGRRLEGIDDDTTTWLGGIDVPDRAADQQSPTQEGEK